MEETRVVISGATTCEADFSARCLPGHRLRGKIQPCVTILGPRRWLHDSPFVSVRFSPACLMLDPCKTQLVQWHSQQGIRVWLGAPKAGVWDPRSHHHCGPELRTVRRQLCRRSYDAWWMGVAKQGGLTGWALSMYINTQTSLASHLPISCTWLPLAKPP